MSEQRNIRKMSTRKLVYLGLFIALGVIIPQAFHMVGGPGAGAMFLPMHFPVIVGAMLLGPISGVIIALVSLVIGVSLGMPPIYIAIFMAVEMSVYALVSGYLYQVKKTNVYVALIPAMLLGRAVVLLVLQFTLNLVVGKVPPVYGSIAMFSAGIPGMIIQVILIPALIITLERVLGREGRLSIQ